MAYSLNGATPVSVLPFRVRYQGQTYTDPTQWFPLIGAALGWEQVPDSPSGGAEWYDGQWYEMPSYDANLQHRPVWSGTAWSVIDKTLDDRKAEKRAALTSRFTSERDKGVMVNGALIETTPQAQGEVQALLADLQRREAAGESNPTQKIATRSGAVMTATTAVAAALVEGVAAHICAVWENDATLNEAIAAAANNAALDAIDIGAGWPS